MTRQVTLPYPPSSNRYWRHWRGRVVVSNEARRYRGLVAMLAKAGGLRPFNGEIALKLDFYRPRKQGDLSNRIKILEDALRGIGFEDDRQVADLHARRFEGKERPRVEVWISTLGDANSPKR